ncbi:MAG TPA: DUF4129 domain-containing protein [Chroococcales cyanobacterium]|jgi:hypothetical protein
MPANAFEKNNLGWQLGQLRQRVWEWFELKTSQTFSDISLPSWWDWPILQLIAKVVAFATLAILLTWIFWQLWQLLRPYLYSLRKQLRQPADRVAKTESSELSVAAWLQRSSKSQQQGNYREACRCLYMAMLQRLNDSGIAPHQSSRTDGEYLQLIQQLPQPRPYQTLLVTHQRLCFSQTEASRSVFDQCQQAYRDIEAT